MHWKKTVLNLFAIFTILWMSTNKVAACLMSVAMDFSDIRQADLVVKSTVIDYEPHKRTPYTPAIITLSVDKTYLGEAQRTLTLAWPNSTFGTPETWQESGRSRDIIVAAMKPGRRLPLRGPSATIRPPARPDLFQVAQAPCAPPFMFEFSVQMEQQVKVALSLAGQSDTAEREHLLRKYFGFRIPFKSFKDAVKAASSRMRRLDIDDDGFSTSDVVSQMRLVSAKAYAARYSRLLIYDLDRDGSVALDEVRVWLMHAGHRNIEEIFDSGVYKEIKQGDLNGDSIIASDELARFAWKQVHKRKKEILESQRHELERVITLFDINGDQAVSMDEIRKAIRQALSYYGADVDRKFDKDAKPFAK